MLDGATLLPLTDALDVGRLKVPTTTNKKTVRNKEEREDLVKGEKKMVLKQIEEAENKKTEIFRLQ